jgi:hypothetical protein
MTQQWVKLRFTAQDIASEFAGDVIHKLVVFGNLRHHVNKNENQLAIALSVKYNIPCKLTNFVGIMRTNSDINAQNAQYTHVPIIETPLDHEWEKERLKNIRYGQNYMYSNLQQNSALNYQYDSSVAGVSYPP